MAKRPASQVVMEDGDVLEIMPLGAGNEVGRSCILVTFKGKKIMLDCGIHPAYAGLAGLPFFDEIDDPSTIDLLLVSHFHLDHAAALPYFLEKTSFKGKVFMTHPTKAIYKMLLMDFVKVSNIAIEDILYDENNLNESMEKIEQINYHQQREVNGIKFWCYNAGHVLGAAMFMVEIAGVRLLYTGDFSRQEDRHLMAAETPSYKPDILIVESTYGVQIHEPRKEREARFTGLVHDIVRRGGRCLIPVFALGRAQELLLILDEYWEAHRELRNVPIYYASTLAKKCMKVYQTYINMMNDKIKKQFAVDNPFVFKHISNLKGMDQFDDAGPSVVMASPGMLQSGLSRELFELWCSDKKNGVILPGYCVEGTLAKHIMSEPSEISTLAGNAVPLRLSVHYISFSAHSDFKQTSEFIDILQPPYVVLVHGDANEMYRLKQALVDRYSGKQIEILTPKNCQTVQLRFRSDKTAKVVGSLAARQGRPSSAHSPAVIVGGPAEGEVISGVVVEKDFTYQIISPQDIPNYTQLATTVITQKLTVPFHRPFALLHRCLSTMFDLVESIKRNDKEVLLVHSSSESPVLPEPTPNPAENVKKESDENPTEEEIERAEREEERQHREQELLKRSTVTITPLSNNAVQLEWVANPVTDMLADALVAALLQLEANPTVAEAAATRVQFQSPEERLQLFRQLLSAHYGESRVSIDEPHQKALVTLESSPTTTTTGSSSSSAAAPTLVVASCDPSTGEVVCDSPIVREGVQLVCQRAFGLLPSLPRSLKAEGL